MSSKIVAIFLLPLLIISLALNIYQYNKKQSANVIMTVVDGDTFQLASGKRVRLAGVNAPEYDHCGGKEAKERLSSLILNKRVHLTEETNESFGRSLALVYVDDVLVNEVMLKEGWGRTDYQKNSQRDLLTQAFHEGQNNKRGIFSDLCRDTSNIPPSLDCVIKGNIDKSTYDKFYHLPNCKQYKQIVIDKDLGESWFCTEEEAQKAGFVKSRNCP
jgi:micrococcal nuclease